MGAGWQGRSPKQYWVSLRRLKREYIVAGYSTGLDSGWLVKNAQAELTLNRVTICLSPLLLDIAASA